MKDGEVTISNFIMTFVGMECPKEIIFKYKAGSAIDFSRIKIKSLVILPSMYGWFLDAD